jgi:hypothetical protein
LPALRRRRLEVVALIMLGFSPALRRPRTFREDQLVPHCALEDRVQDRVVLPHRARTRPSAVALATPLRDQRCRILAIGRRPEKTGCSFR